MALNGCVNEGSLGVMNVPFLWGMLRMAAGARHVWGKVSAPSPWFFHESKPALKNKVLIKMGEKYTVI